MQTAVSSCTTRTTPPLAYTHQWGGRGPGAGGRQGPRRAADAVADTARRGRREAQIRRPPRPGRRVPPVARPRSYPAPPPARAELGAGGGSGEGAELGNGGGSGEGPP